MHAVRLRPVAASLCLYAAVAAAQAPVAEFRIHPLRPVEQLRREAALRQTPAGSGDFLPADLVELVTLDRSIHLDIRYATKNNFLGVPF